MEEKQFEKLLIKMSNLININNKKSKRAFPVSCIFFNEENKITYSAINLRSQNKETTNYKNHAEYLCLKKTQKKFGKKRWPFKKIIAIITLPPCFNCLNEMKKFKEIKWEIYYLDDRMRNKAKKDTLLILIKAKIELNIWISRN